MDRNWNRDAGIALVVGGIMGIVTLLGGELGLALSITGVVLGFILLYFHTKS